MTEYAVIDGQRVELTEWFPAEVKPVHVGYFGVSSSFRTNHRHRGHLTGRPQRYWDGENWRAWKGGPVSIFGTSHFHQWRGLSHPPGAT